MQLKRRALILGVSEVISFSIFLTLLCATSQAQVRHRVLISGAGLGYVAIVGADGTVEWKHDEARQANDSWFCRNGNIAFSYEDGMKLVRPDYSDPSGNELLWVYENPPGTETHSCQPLDDGSRFLIGQSNETTSYLVVLDTNETEHFRAELPDQGTGSHQQLRHVRITPQGTYLTTSLSLRKAIEYGSDGSFVREFVDGRFGAYRVENGNTLIACGDEGRVIEVDPDDNIVWEVNREDIEGMVMGFVAGLARLPNGNTMICNWTGHGEGHGPPVFEVTPGLEVVWALDTGYQDLLGKRISNQVSSITVLDSGCTDSLADNYASMYLFDNGSCTYTGCADSTADNFYCGETPEAAPCMASPRELDKISGKECTYPAGLGDLITISTPAIHHSPGESIIEVGLHHGSGNHRIFLYNAAGSKIYSRVGKGVGSYRFHLEAGIYYVMVEWENAEYSERVVLF
jgi:hypothetical protein